METLVEMIQAPGTDDGGGPGCRTPLLAIFSRDLASYASGRSAWSSDREASGHSVLGTLVDALGIFSSSALVNPVSHDERVLKAAGSLGSLLARSTELSQASWPLTRQCAGRACSAAEAGETAARGESVHPEISVHHRMTAGLALGGRPRAGRPKPGPEPCSWSGPRSGQQRRRGRWRAVPPSREHAFGTNTRVALW